MGFALSVLYFVTYYLTPGTVFGSLAVARVQLILAVIALLISLPKLMRATILKTPQFVALIGLSFATFLSVLIAARWPGGAVQAVLGFIPCAFAYYLVVLQCNSKKKLKLLVLMLLFVCLFVIAHGCIKQIYGIPDNAPPDTEATDNQYLISMKNNAGDWFYRLRGLGEINDPNDFGQLIVCAIPLLFIFWRAKKIINNIVFVILPVCTLLFGTYLTHSRGALVALTAMAVVAGRRRIGTLPALILAAGLFAGAIALHFTGGRDISIDAGSDRTALWSESMQALKNHPLFGVGIGSLGEYTETHHTAHNSVMVCAAELGFFGLFYWCMFLFSTLRDAIMLSSPTKVSEAELTIPVQKLFPRPESKIESVDKIEINQLGKLLVLSLTGFLIAGWFLSRAYALTFFLLGGATAGAKAGEGAGARAGAERFVMGLAAPCSCCSDS